MLSRLRYITGPNWSIAELIPTQSNVMKRMATIPVERINALAGFKMVDSCEGEQDIRKTLATQLEFLKQVQSIDTTGIEPLSSVLPESEQERVLDYEDAFHESELNEKEDVLAYAADRLQGRYYTIEGEFKRK